MCLFKKKDLKVFKQQVIIIMKWRGTKNNNIKNVCKCLDLAGCVYVDFHTKTGDVHK